MLSIKALCSAGLSPFHKAPGMQPVAKDWKQLQQQQQEAS